MVESETRPEENAMEQFTEDEEEPFLLRERSREEIQDYDAGFKASSEGKDLDVSKSVAWQMGWSEAQE
jgi:hypothetical protein